MCRPTDQCESNSVYVVENVIDDFRRWSNDAVASSPKTAFAVEDELNRWLSISYLLPPPDAEVLDFEADRDIAKAFVKQHGLTTKLAKQRSSGEEDPRIKTLEQQVRQYADENRQLEEMLRRLGERGSTPRPRGSHHLGQLHRTQRRVAG